jgi:hypothetical protein
MPKIKGSALDSRKNGSKALPVLPQRHGGGETPSKTEYSRDAKEDEDEGEIIFPRSPLHETLLSPGEIFAWQMGVPASAHRAKCPKWMPAGVQPVIVAWPHSGMFCPAGNMCLLH